MHEYQALTANHLVYIMYTCTPLADQFCFPQCAVTQWRNVREYEFGGVDYWSACHTRTPKHQEHDCFVTLVVRAITHEAVKFYYLRHVLIWQLTRSTVCLLHMLAW